MQFTEDPWIQGQKDLKITYHTDTVGIKDFIHPSEKSRKKHEKNQKKKDEGKKGWDNWTWLEKKVTTGYRLTDTTFFMHPPRENQYDYNEISNMPDINLNKLFTGGNWAHKLLILTSWYKGTVESLYQVTGKTVYENGSLNIREAWDIKVEHAHSRLGQYQSRIIFDQASHGFLHFDNSFPDGNRIVMSLIEVKTVPHQK